LLNIKKKTKSKDNIIVEPNINKIIISITL